MEKMELSPEESEIIRRSVPYQEFVKAHPDASVESFIEDRVKDIKGFLFAKRFNKSLTPLQHYLKLGTIQHQEMFREWGIDVSAIAENINTATLATELQDTENVLPEHSKTIEDNQNLPKSEVEETQNTSSTTKDEISSEIMQETIHEQENVDEQNVSVAKETFSDKDFNRYMRMDIAELMVNSFDYTVDEQGYIFAADKPLVLQLWKNEEFREKWTQFLSDVENKNIALPSSKLYTSALEYVRERLALKEAQITNYLHSDRPINFSTDTFFAELAAHIPELKKDFDTSADKESPEKGNTKKQRQKIVDFLRFMESGKVSREAIKNKDWDFLRKEYIRFPKVPTPVLFQIYENQLKKDANDDQIDYLLKKFTAHAANKDNLPILLKAIYKDNSPSDRTEMLQRIILMRFDNLHKGKWHIKNDEELKIIEDFIASEKERDSAFCEKLELYRVIEKYKKEKSEKNQEEQATSSLIIHEGPSIESAKPNIHIPSAAPDKHEEKKQSTDTPSSEKQVTDNESTLPDNNIKEKEDIKPVIEKEEEKTAENASVLWQKKTVISWKKWAQKNDKSVKEYIPDDNPLSLGLKIYKNDAQQDNDLPETDILYKNPKEIIVTGKTDISLFENIVAEAKKTCSEIKFGEINSPDFKAKLWLACLRDPEIKIIDAPKIRDLQGADENIIAEIKKIKKERAQYRQKKDKRINQPWKKDLSR